MNKHIFTGVFESPHLTETKTNTCCLGSWAMYTWALSFESSMSLDTWGFGCWGLEPTTGVDQLPSTEKGVIGPASGHEFVCHRKSTVGLRTVGSGKFQSCLEYNHVVGCEQGMEPPACISESLEFLEWGQNVEEPGSLLGSFPRARNS